MKFEAKNEFFKTVELNFKSKMELCLIQAKIIQLVWKEQCLMDRLQFEIDPDYMATPEIRRLGRKIEKKISIIQQELEKLEEQQYLASQAK